MDKYEDMAYINERGQAWFQVLLSPPVWNKWVTRVARSTRDVKVFGTPEEYARRILIEAIWHRGYAKNLTDPRAMARCARRLRQPRERGEGHDPRGRSVLATDLTAHGMPMEFTILDEFLEKEVRPIL